MKVKVQIRGTVTYMGELTMSKAAYRNWCDKIDAAKGFQMDTVSNELIEKIGLDLADPSDWGEMEVDTFEAV
jgi:hypothetical protein